MDNLFSFEFVSTMDITIPEKITKTLSQIFRSIQSLIFVNKLFIDVPIF